MDASAQMRLSDALPDDMVALRCPKVFADRVQGYIDALVEGGIAG